MEHVAGLTVGGKGSIDLGRELRAAVKDRTCKVHGVPRVLVLLLVWHLIASFWGGGARRVFLGCREVARSVVGCFLLERHAGPRTTLLAFPAEGSWWSLLLERRTLLKRCEEVGGPKL
jgi:hypothetical protein